MVRWRQTPLSLVAAVAGIPKWPYKSNGIGAGSGRALHLEEWFVSCLTPRAQQAFSDKMILMATVCTTNRSIGLQCTLTPEDQVHIRTGRKLLIGQLLLVHWSSLPIPPLFPRPQPSLCN